MCVWNAPLLCAPHLVLVVSLGCFFQRRDAISRAFSLSVGCACVLLSNTMARPERLDLSTSFLFLTFYRERLKSSTDISYSIDAFLIGGTGLTKMQQQGHSQFGWDYNGWKLMHWCHKKEPLGNHRWRHIVDEHTKAHCGSEQDRCYGLWPVVLFLCQHMLLPSPAEPRFCPLSQQCAIHGQKTTAHPPCSPLIYASATWRSVLSKEIDVKWQCFLMGLWFCLQREAGCWKSEWVFSGLTESPEWISVFLGDTWCYGFFWNYFSSEKQECQTNLPMSKLKNNWFSWLYRMVL